MHIIKRSLLGVVKVFFILSLLIGGIIYFTLATQSGFKTSVELITRFSLPGLQIEKIEGTWLGKATFSRISYIDKTQRITIDTINTEFTPQQLFKGTLHFTHLHLGSVHIQPIADTSKTNPTTLSDMLSEQSTQSLAEIKSKIFTLPNLPQFPLTLDWNELKIDAIHYQDTHIERFQSQGYITSNKRSLQMQLKSFQATIDKDLLTATGQFHWHKKGLSADNVRVKYRDNTVFLDGGAGKPVIWEINLFKETDKNFIRASGSFQGDGLETRLIAKVKANVEQGETRLTGIHADIALNAKQNNKLHLTIQEGLFNQQRVRKLALDSTGPLNKQQYKLSFTPDKLPRTEITGEWEISQAKLLKKKIEANITFSSDSLHGFVVLMPKIQNLQGSLHGHVHVTGSLEKLGYNAKMTLEHGRFKIPSLGLAIHDATITAEKSHPYRDGFDIAGKLQSGEGILHLQGKQFFNPDNKNNKLTLTGENILVANTSEFTVSVNPNLTVTLTADHKLMITGDILIPKAKLLPEAVAGKESISDDIIFKPSKKDKQKQKQESDDASMPLYLDVTLTAGKSINLIYGDFSANLAGKLKISKKPQQPMTAQGELIIQNGLYHAHGQKLSINNGRLLFMNDTITNPRLDVIATRSVSVVSSSKPSLPVTGLFASSNLTQTPTTSKVEVGVHVTGKADKPRYKLFSKPATLSPGEILSYLVLGHSLDDAANDSAGLLMQAASSLKLKGKDVSGITNQVQSWLGLDQVGFKSVKTRDANTNTFTPKTALNLGKKLSPRLYLDYTVGLFDPVNILKLRYQLKDNWIIETETDQDNSGIDLFYNIETN